MAIGLDVAVAVLVPSWKELNMSLVTAVLLVFLYGLLQQTLFPDDKESSYRGGKRSPRSNLDLALEPREVNLSILSSKTQGMQLKDGFGALPGGPLPGGRLPVSLESDETSSANSSHSCNMTYVIQLELFAAKNLPGTNINGTCDPYAVLTCGNQKRFSSVVPGSRNPMWGEEFVFHSEELPVNITITIYDWDIVWKSAKLGMVTISIMQTGLLRADWHTLDRAQGQLCVQVNTSHVNKSQINGKLMVGGVNTARRRLSQEQQQQQLQQGATEVRQKPGPLQNIFDLPPDEEALHSYSCALERSFLYHGRMYVSAYNICFRSNIFAKGLKIIIPYEDIREIRKSSHALINPAVTVVLRQGAGGHGVPPLADPEGRAKYKFASFWNRNHALRALLRQFKAFKEMELVAAQEVQQLALRSRSQNEHAQAPAAEKTSPEAVLERALSPPRSPRAQPFLNDVPMADIMVVKMPCSVEEWFSLIWHENSSFLEQYRGERRDTHLVVEPWHVTDEYGGLLRKVTFRSVCHSPMCPPDTAMTDWQHLSATKGRLVLESIQQAHDVPFGSTFEVQARWVVATESAGSCTIVITAGTHFKKWGVMQFKIRSSAVIELKADCELFMRLAREWVETQKGRQE